MHENTTMSVSRSETVMAYSPLLFVVVPRAEPATRTVANSMGLLCSSLTLPSIFMFASAKPRCADAKSTSSMIYSRASCFVIRKK